nr:YlxR family protein [Williamsoniiplasma somnilux]
MNITKNKKTNFRKDISSNQMFIKNELIRIVKNKANEIFIDKTFKAAGHGVYIFPSINAFEIVKKRNLLSRSFKKNVSEEIYNSLLLEIKEHNKNG